MLYLVIAKDGSDEGAPERRRAVREQHLKEIHPALESGALKLGGALLDGETMIGSMLLVEAGDETELRGLLERDIYHRAGVWQSYEIYPFRRAVGLEL